MRVPALAVVAVYLLLGQAMPAWAQGRHAEGVRHPDPTTWEGQLTVLGVNAVLGGLTGGVRSQWRGGSFWRGFAHGAAGGATIYAGKYLSTERTWGAGLAGRQVATIGASMIRNASEGRAPFEQLMLAAGPLRLYLDRGEAPAHQLKLDLLGTAVLAYRSLSPDTRFDSGASLSAGTPVFLTEEAVRPGWHGNHIAGVILLLDEASAAGARSRSQEVVFAHERIHLLQYDQVHHTWGAPVEAWLLRRIPGGSTIGRHLDLGLLMLPVALLNGAIDYDRRPWEQEAHFFSESAERVLTAPQPRPAKAALH